VLVSAPPPESDFAQHPDWIVYEPVTVYVNAWAKLVVELAATDPAIAAGVVRYALHAPVATPIACELLSKTNAGQVKLERRWVDELLKLGDAGECD
jgi:hypothetical protein